jgi:hypothetical protein
MYDKFQENWQTEDVSGSPANLPLLDCLRTLLLLKPRSSETPRPDVVKFTTTKAATPTARYNPLLTHHAQSHHEICQNPLCPDSPATTCPPHLLERKMPALSHLHLHGISFLPLEKADVHRVA